jgi:hypothetical protein
MKTRNPFANLSAGSRVPLVALLVIQAVIAYEWINSAFTKIVHGGFASGLADELAKNSDGAPAWYQTALHAVMIPNAAIFGYMIEAGELVVGVALIATAAVLLARGANLSVGTLRVVLAVAGVAAVGGAFMNLNFSLFAGDTPVWSLGSDTFSEGISIDGVLMLMQFAIAATSAATVYSLRERSATRTAGSHRPQVASRAA